MSTTDHEHESSILGRCKQCGIPLNAGGTSSFMPERVRLERRLGYRKPRYAVNVTRPGKWGNPFSIGDTVLIGPNPGGIPIHSNLVTGVPEGYEVRELLTLADCYEVHELWIRADDQRSLRDLARLELKGRDLACWCPLSDEIPDPTPCHAKTLIYVANPRPGEAL